MYAAEIVLPRESTMEAVKRMHSAFGTLPLLLMIKDVIGGAIKHEEGHDASMLELKLQVGMEGFLLPVTTIIKAKRVGDCGDISPGYKILEAIYGAMKAKHGETVIPMGIHTQNTLS